MIVLRRILLLGAAALLVWRIGAVGMASHYAAQVQQGEIDAASKALTWEDRQPQALYGRALALRAQDPGLARDLLVEAYAQNPADARPLIAAAYMVLAEGDQARADALVQTATRLLPADPRIHKRAADYWIYRGDLREAMRFWSRALQTDPGMHARLFPVLLELADNPRTRLLIRPYALAPPSWWQAFFSLVARRALETDTVRVLYALRRESALAPITESERQGYVSRMIRDGSIANAYIAWVNSLAREERRHLGLLHDGGFELEPGNWGFGWRIRSMPSARIGRGHTYGTSGEKSLHLLFKQHERPFRHLSQQLLLDPGPYRLSGKVRTDSLESRGGLKWVVRCLQSQEQRLGESERFLGANRWRDFGFEFRVPEGCGLQEIRLVSAGKRAFEHRITGGAWFDRMAIRRVPENAKAPGAEPEPDPRQAPDTDLDPAAEAPPAPVVLPSARAPPDKGAPTSSSH